MSVGRHLWCDRFVFLVFGLFWAIASIVCSMESIGIDDCFVLPLNFDSFCAQVFVFVEVDISLDTDMTLSRPIDPDALQLIINAHKPARISAWL